MRIIFDSVFEEKPGFPVTAMNNYGDDMFGTRHSKYSIYQLTVRVIESKPFIMIPNSTTLLLSYQIPPVKTAFLLKTPAEDMDPSIVLVINSTEKASSTIKPPPFVP